MCFFVKKLNGHSGCHVNLIKSNSGEQFYVLKESGCKEYNYRLKIQCKKQKLFKHQFNVLAPKILETGYKDKLFYFSMEYIAGRTLAEHTEKVRILEIGDLIKRLFNCILTSNISFDTNNHIIFMNKIDSLKYLLEKHKHLYSAFHILENFNWNNVQKSYCHGDLTLENILITDDNKIYLIDFLDSFYNSWQIDVAKLLQDLELGWSFRNEKMDSNRSLRLQIAKKALIEEILMLNNGESLLNTIYHLLLLNVIRIYPYTNDQLTLNFLDNAVDHIVNIIYK